MRSVDGAVGGACRCGSPTRCAWQQGKGAFGRCGVSVCHGTTVTGFRFAVWRSRLWARSRTGRIGAIRVAARLVAIISRRAAAPRTITANSGSGAELSRKRRTTTAALRSREVSASTFPSGPMSVHPSEDRVGGHAPVNSATRRPRRIRTPTKSANADWTPWTLYCGTVRVWQLFAWVLVGSRGSIEGKQDDRTYLNQIGFDAQRGQIQNSKKVRERRSWARSRPAAAFRRRCGEISRKKDGAAKATYSRRFLKCYQSIQQSQSSQNIRSRGVGMLKHMCELGEFYRNRLPNYHITSACIIK